MIFVKLRNASALRIKSASDLLGKWVLVRF